MATAKKKGLKLEKSNVFGIVKWFNKGNGRITIKEYDDVFVHFSEISKPAAKCWGPPKFLKKGQTVQCNLRSGPKGIQATDIVVVIDSSEDSGDTQKDSDATINVNVNVTGSHASECSINPPATTNIPASDFTVLERDLRGEVLSFNEQRGFGFIKSPQYGNIFCHNAHIAFAGLHATEKVLTPTQFVKCDIARGEKGLMAVNVHVISDAAPELNKRKKKERSPSASRQPKKQTQAATDKVEKAEHVDNQSVSPILHSNVFGEVLHYNAKKNFGFLKVPIHGNVFVHRRSLVNCTDLQSKQVVRFDIVKGPKTLMAINVTVIAEGIDPQDKKPTPIKKDETESKVKDKSKKKNKGGAIEAASIPAENRALQSPPLAVTPVRPHCTPLMEAPPAYSYSVPVMPQLLPDFPSPPSMPFGAMPPPYQPSDQVFSNMLTKLADTKLGTQEKKTASSKPQNPKASNESQLRKEIGKELVCGICEDLLDDPVSTPCAHLFCRACLLEWLPYNPTCPIDRTPVLKDSVTDAPRAIKIMLSKV